MELFGMAFSIPVSLVMNIVYCRLVTRFIQRSTRLSRAIIFVSFILLGWFAVELLLLMTIGAIRSREVIGGAFSFAHVVLFFLGTPALANVLLLNLQGQRTFGWFGTSAVVGICTFFAFCLVILQYAVSEKLYGINGDDGPFSQSWTKTIVHLNG